MDIQMPEINGLDALIAIKSEVPDAKVIVLTTCEGDVHILRALKAGAQGYLLQKHAQLWIYCRPSGRCMRAGGACQPGSHSRSPSMSAIRLSAAGRIGRSSFP